MSDTVMISIICTLFGICVYFFLRFLRSLDIHKEMETAYEKTLKELISDLKTGTWKRFNLHHYRDLTKNEQIIYNIQSSMVSSDGRVKDCPDKVSGGLVISNKNISFESEDFKYQNEIIWEKSWNDILNWEIDVKTNSLHVAFKEGQKIFEFYHPKNKIGAVVFDVRYINEFMNMAYKASKE